MDQVEHHVFIINKYKQPVLSMWSIRIGPNLLIMDILLVLTLRGHHVVGDSRYLQSICNHWARHSRTWNSRRKRGTIWWRSRAPASYKWANLHESLSFCWYTLAFRVALFFMLEFLWFPFLNQYVLCFVGTRFSTIIFWTIPFFFDAGPLEKNFSRKVILPGSFNPLHDGHLRLLEVASRFVFLPLELWIENSISTIWFHRAKD